MSFVPVTIGSLFPFYIKKEDARDISKTQRKFAGFVVIGESLVLGIMHSVVWPKLQSMLIEFDIQNVLLNSVETTSIVTIFLIAIGILTGLYLLISEPNYDRVNRVIKNSKKSDMIKTKEIIDPKAGYIVMVTTFLMVTYLVIAFILPIYNLTSSL